MMKRAKRSLKVSRETLRRLDFVDLGQIRGGGHTAANRMCSPSGFYACGSIECTTLDEGCYGATDLCGNTGQCPTVYPC